MKQDNYFIKNKGYSYFTGRLFQPYSVNSILLRPMSWNLYLYVNNDPLNYIDPEGTLEVQIEAGTPLNLEYAIKDINAWENFQYMQTLFMFQKNEMVYYLNRETYLGQITIDYGNVVEVIAKEGSIKETSKNYKPYYKMVRKPFAKRWCKNFETTNKIIPGLIAPWGMGSITSKAMSKAMEMPTFLNWALKGFKGLESGGIAFNSLETGIMAGYHWAVNYLFVGVSFEVGLAVGSAINAAIFPDLDY